MRMRPVQFGPACCRVGSIVQSSVHSVAVAERKAGRSDAASFTSRNANFSDLGMSRYFLPSQAVNCWHQLNVLSFKIHVCVWLAFNPARVEDGYLGALAAVYFFIELVNLF